MIVEATVSVKCQSDFRSSKLAGMFDLAEEKVSTANFSIELPDLEEPWEIGAIVGPSGSGKTTIARKAYNVLHNEGINWSKGKSVISDMPGEVHTAAKLLTQVGFGSPPAWLRPFHTLSNGEQFRACLARSLMSEDDVVVFDEFTSVVDRTVAKFGSAAISRAIRRQKLGKRFVAISCHYDFLRWLEPDWVADMANGTLTRRRLRRPKIKLLIRHAQRSEWELFRRHHYLSDSLPRSANQWIAEWEGRPCCFVSDGAMTGKKSRKRITRIVTLPDFQGLGIGMRMCEWAADRLHHEGHRVNITTSHPSMIRALERSARWDLIKVWSQWRTHRKVASFEWRHQP